MEKMPVKLLSAENAIYKQHANTVIKRRYTIRLGMLEVEYSNSKHSRHSN